MLFGVVMNKFDAAFLSIVLAVMTAFSMYYIETHKDWCDRLRIPDKLIDGNSIKINSRKTVIPILTDPNRTIGILIKTDDNEKTMYRVNAKANEDGFILFHVIMDDVKEVTFYISLNKKIDNPIDADERITFELPDVGSYDYKVDYSNKAKEDESISAVVSTTTINPMFDSENIRIFFNSDHEFDETFKEFIKFSVSDYEYYLAFIKEINNIDSDKMYIYYNDEKIGYVENKEICFEEEKED